jgi:uncharacterized membrane protein YbhN (UPF0104 family)
LTGERAEQLPDALAGRNLARHTLVVVGILAAVGLVIALAPGLGQIRDELNGINGWWIAVAVVLEILSSASYVLLFRPVFCPSMSWKLSNQIAWSEVGVGSILPASGIGGLALGAWVLRQAGMSTNLIARRSVAFFLIKGSVNFVLVAVLGTGMALGLFGPDLSLWLTALPAALAFGVLAGVVAIPRLGHGADPRTFDSRVRRAIAAARNALVDGSAEAIQILRSRNWMAIAGAVGYYAFDNAMMWATYKAVGVTLPLSVLMMGYLIGQLGGLLPLPGGIGGIDGGLIGSLIVYGAPAAATATAVLAFRVILFWIPLIGGAIAFAGLRRSLATMDTQSVCRAGVQQA